MLFQSLLGWDLMNVPSALRSMRDAALAFKGDYKPHRENHPRMIDVFFREELHSSRFERYNDSFSCEALSTGSLDKSIYYIQNKF